MRREDDGAAFVGHRSDDGFENVAADDGIQSRTWLVEDQQVRAMGLGGDQAESRVLSLGERSDACVWVESKLFTQLLGIGRVPARIEGLRISQQLSDPHPS